MALVKKANTEMTIADNLVDEYLEKGYSLLDSKGKVVRRKNTDAEVIKCLKKENDELKVTISKLKDEINALKTSHSSSKGVLNVSSSNNPRTKTRANKGV